MAAENDKVVTITIVGKNLSADTFQQVREGLAGVKKGSDDTSKSLIGGGGLKEAFLGAKDGGALLEGQVSKLVAGLSISALIDKVASSAVEYTKQIYSNADALVLQNDKTGISIEWLQRWQAAAKKSNIDSQALAEGAYKFGIAFEAATDDFKKALRDVGLSYDDLKSKSPEERFDAVLRSLGAVTDISRRNYDGNQLLSKSYQELAAVLPTYAKNVDSVEVESESLIRSLHRQSEAIDELETRIANQFTSSVGGLSLVLNGLADGGDNAKRALAAVAATATQTGPDWSAAGAILAGYQDHVSNLTREEKAHIQMLVEQGRTNDVIVKAVASGSDELAAATIKYAESLRTTAKPHQDFVQSLAESKATLKALTPEIVAQMTAGLGLGHSTKEVADEVKNMAGAQKVTVEVVELFKDKLAEQKTASEKAAEAARQHKAAVDEVAAAHMALLPSQIADIKAMNDSHISVTKIANDLHLYESQVQRVLQAEKDDIAWKKAVATTAQEWWNDQIKKANQLGDETIKTYKETESARTELQARLDVIGETGLQRRLTEIDSAEAKELQSIENLKVKFPAFYKERADLIGEYYQHERDLANHTADTIEERMGDQGVFVKRVLQQNAIDARTDYEQMLASGQYTAEQLQAAWEKWYAADRTARGQMQSSWSKALDALAADIQQLAQIGGDTFGGIAKSAGVFISTLKLASDSEAKLQEGLQAMHDGAPGGFAKTVAGAMGLVAAMDQITSSGNRAMQAIGGAQVGSELGESIGKMFGPAGEVPGMILGAVGGALIGALRQPEFKKAGKDLASDFGQAFSEELSKKIADAEKTISGGTKDQRRDWAEALNLDSIITEMGGANAGNISKIEGQFDSLFELIQRGGPNGAKATTELGKAFDELAPVAMKTTGLIDSGLAQVIARAKAAGVEVKEITDFMTGQRDAASTGIAAALHVATAAYTSIGDDEQKIADLRSQLSDDQATDLAKIMDLKEKMKGADDAHAAAYQVQIDKLTGGQSSLIGQIETLTADLGTQKQVLELTSVTGQKAADGIAASIVGLVDASIASGKSFVDAVRGQQGAVSDLAAQMQRAGVDGGEAFDFIKGEVDLVNDKIGGPALQVLEGYTAGMVGLANAGDLTQDKFIGLTSQLGRTYEGLVALGKDPKVVMAGMQDDLQKAWELQQRFGYVTDEATQKLIDEAVATGAVGETHKTSTEQMIDGIKVVGDELKELVSLFRDGVGGAIRSIGTTAKQVFDDVTDDMNNLPKDIHFNVSASGGAGGGSGAKIPQYARGGIAQGPQIAMIAEGGHKEIVGDVAFMQQAIAGAFARLGVNGLGGSGGGDRFFLVDASDGGSMSEMSDNQFIDRFHRLMAAKRLRVSFDAIVGRAA